MEITFLEYFEHCEKNKPNSNMKMDHHSSEHNSVVVKGQLISKGLFDVIVLTKKPTKLF